MLVSVERSKHWEFYKICIDISQAFDSKTVKSPNSDKIKTTGSPHGDSLFPVMFTFNLNAAITSV